jgi:hypothetical protein
MADLIASLRERACADGSFAKPQGEKRTKTAITTVRETSDLDIVCLICLTWIRQLKGQTNHVQAIEITGDYDPTVSNVDKNSNPRPKFGTT